MSHFVHATLQVINHLGYAKLDKRYNKLNPHQHKDSKFCCLGQLLTLSKQRNYQPPKIIYQSSWTNTVIVSRDHYVFGGQQMSELSYTWTLSWCLHHSVLYILTQETLLIHSHIHDCTSQWHCTWNIFSLRDHLMEAWHLPPMNKMGLQPATHDAERYRISGISYGSLTLIVVCCGYNLPICCRGLHRMAPYLWSNPEEYR